jgi:thiopurine S-methyltransferase
MTYKKTQLPEKKIQTVRYWDNQYINNQTGWDIGYASPPIREYFEQQEDQSARILVPGSGNGWEVEYLYQNGWQQTFLLDFAPAAIDHFTDRFPQFPASQIIRENFFEHQGTYDYIVEQTFFSSLPRSYREQYVKQALNLLAPGGKLIGLLFNHEFAFDGPPFGGTEAEYKDLFFNSFHVKSFGTAYNSIKPRRDREYFIILEKPFKS